MVDPGRDLAPVEDSGGDGVDPGVLREKPLQGDKQFGLSRVTEIPILVPSAPETRDEEEEEDNWLSPMDLLADEDLYGAGGEPSEDAMESADPKTPDIVDWDDLQSHMIEREMSEPKGSEWTDPETGEPRQGNREEPEPRRTENTGLSLESAMRGDEMGDFGADGSEESTEGAETSGERNDILDSAMQVNTGRAIGEIPYLQREDREADRERELQGSRQLLDEVRNRWRPVGLEAGGGSTPPVEREPVRTATTAVGPPPSGQFDSTLRRGPDPGAFPSAVRMESVRMPENDRSISPPSRREPATREDTPSDVSGTGLNRADFRPTENRIRSRLGE